MEEGWGGDFAGDGGEGGDGLAEVVGLEVGGEAGVDGCDEVGEVGVCFGDGLVVACVGDDDAFFGGKLTAYVLVDLLAEVVDALRLGGGYGQDGCVGGVGGFECPGDEG